MQNKDSEHLYDNDNGQYLSTEEWLGNKVKETKRAFSASLPERSAALLKPTLAPSVASGSQSDNSQNALNFAIDKPTKPPYCLYNSYSACFSLRNWLYEDKKLATASKDDYIQISPNHI